jgi:sulfite exporter TauE/SafE
VYSLLATALLTGSPTGGAAVMAAFGAGTLPNLLAAGMILERARALSHRRALRMAAGGLVTGFGIVGLVRSAELADHIRRGLLCL